MDHYPPDPSDPPTPPYPDDPQQEPEPWPNAGSGLAAPQPFPFATSDTLPRDYVPSEPPAAISDSYRPDSYRPDSYRPDSYGYGAYAAGAAVPPASPRPPRRSRRRAWLLIGIAALILAVLVGGGVVLAAAQSNSAPAASPVAAIPTATKTHKQPITYIVTQVSGATITATAPNGSTVTINTSPATIYMEKGQAVSLSGIQPGMRIRVEGKNKHGVIAAKKIILLPGK